jgi:transcriptional regulator with XRE-family HTH domain
MAQINAVVETLKRALKASGLTYADVARRLGLSEPSIKRMFSQQRFTLDRLESICAMMALDFTDLVRIVDTEQPRISSLSLEQERELVADPKLLLVAICVQNSWDFEEIREYYDFSEPELIRRLAHLDRLGLVQLLPNNRIRRMVAADFRWLPRGPIERFFEQRVQREYLKSHFTRPEELRLFMIGMLSRKSVETMRRKIEMLAHEFTALQEDDARLPAASRLHTGVLLAIRPWELRDFDPLKRKS